MCPEPLFLRAGPLSLLWHPAELHLRHLRCGDTEVLRGIYAAVRDRDWGTVPARIESQQAEIGPDRFRLRLAVVWSQPGIEFEGVLELEGTPEGQVRYDFDGRVIRPFLRNRIGLVVLHGPTVAGQGVTLEHTNDSVRATAFPAAIAPHQPFLDLRAMTHEPLPGLRVRVAFAGETFETEDQRNWIDASFKTYGTPLALPFPAAVAAGERVVQSVRVELAGAPRITCSAPSGPVRLGWVAGGRALTRPAWGLGLAVDDHGPLDAAAGDVLRALAPDHLRVDLREDDMLWQLRLFAGIVQARAAGCALELALHAVASPGSFAAHVAAELPVALPVARWLAFRRGEKTTGAEALWAVRGALRAAGRTEPVFGGTDAFFTELNRERPPLPACDGLSFSANPQVHAFDNLSLVECAEVLRTCVENARAFAGGLPVQVSPLTLKMRWNPNATGGPDDARPRLPANVDPRQRSPFLAAWTLAALKYLAEGGAAACTLYDTRGWTGIQEFMTGSPLPEHFPSQPGEVFPVAEALRVWAGLRSADHLLETYSDRPLEAVGLGFSRAGRRYLLAINLTAAPLDVGTVQGLCRRLPAYGWEVLTG